MQARTRDMTTGSPLRLILAFCLPIVAGNLFQQLRRCWQKKQTPPQPPHRPAWKR